MRRAILLAGEHIGGKDLGKGGRSLFPSLTVRSSGGFPPCCVPGSPPRPSDRGGSVALNQTSGRFRECASGRVVSGCEEEEWCVVLTVLIEMFVVVVVVEGEGGLFAFASNRLRRGGCDSAVAVTTVVLDRCRRIADEGRDAAVEAEAKDADIVKLSQCGEVKMVNVPKVESQKRGKSKGGRRQWPLFPSSPSKLRLARLQSGERLEERATRPERRGTRPRVDKWKLGQRNEVSEARAVLFPFSLCLCLDKEKNLKQ